MHRRSETSCVLRHGLPLEKVEELLQCGLISALSALGGQRDLTPQELSRATFDRTKSLQRVREMHPTARWVCLAAADYNYTGMHDPWAAMQVMLHSSPGNMRRSHPSPFDCAVCYVMLCPVSWALPCHVLPHSARGNAAIYHHV